MLLCELHAHTSWSDGELTATELVDLYGMNGFDVLCVTDHLLPSQDRSFRLRPATYAHYVKTIEREARRAREQYDLLLIPGAELTRVDADPDEAGHAVAVGLRSYASVDQGLELALRAARGSGAAIIAAHPHGGKDDPRPERTTRWFWRNHKRLDGVVDRYELMNRRQTFGWVAEEDLPALATGDFHRLEHLRSWKTLLPCSKNERAVVGYLRSDRRAYVIPWGLPEELGDPLAA